MDQRRNQQSGTVIAADLSFAITTCIVVVLAHAIAYMTHEYSHTFVAWGLGWMSNPLALDYGKPTLYNLLLLGDVGDNVSYDPIFASGHSIYATIIALADTYVGNALLYFLLYFLAKSDTISSNRLALSLVYWVSLMCAGNVWSYVPIRAITTHADIAIAPKGLRLPAWSLFLVLIGPSLYVVYHFFKRMFPHCSLKLTLGSQSIFVLLIALTSYWCFAFFRGTAPTEAMAWSRNCFPSRPNTFCSHFALSIFHPNIAFCRSSKTSSHD